MQANLIGLLRARGLAASFALSLFAVPAFAQDAGGGDRDDDSAALQAARAAGDAYYKRIAPELAASGQPRDLALAAILLRIGSGGASAPPADFSDDDGSPSTEAANDPRMAAWRSLASARAGSDVLANALLASTRDDAATRAQAATRWRQVEPDNLAPILLGGAGGDALVSATRPATRLDLHFYDLTRWMRGALLAHPPLAAERAGLTNGTDVPAAELATATASSLVAGIALPSFKPIVDACAADSVGTTARTSDCAHVAGVLRETSDTMIGTMVGFAIAQRLPAARDAGASLADQRRAIDWRMQQWGKVAAAQPRNGMADYARLLADPGIDSEKQLIERVLTQAGVPLNPPADWTPPRRGN